MKEGYCMEIVVYRTSAEDERTIERDIDFDLVGEMTIVDDQFLTCAQVIERFRLLHDAVETYKRTEVKNEAVLEEMRQGFDGLILTMCDMCECTEEEE